MKKIIFVSLVILVSASGFIVSKTTQEETILQKVANAHGFDNWANVEEIKFTFNVDRDTTHFERDWTWKPKTNDISATSAEGTISYNWANMDSVAFKTNGGFINDKFWLLAPYQLVWDADNITHTHSMEAEAPISKKTMQKLTIVYGNEGGYTPGDAYDFYLGDDLIIQEWVFRKSNQAEPSMITSFEDYEMINGLNIATMHKMAEGSFKLYFTGVEVN
ncbi:hypothetical protein FEE95_15950 [Maribacter algarum]|uniref:Uncharacterized protein n=1 Tax=Maribacter algarum (ex Zhang et al. 2020) TaxID=2578118 RepID=A0A5S3PP27_9FLAO|nr:hypothetical protein [Maribacter algarum]TMM56121.1 hypothetical protein FEE95_15950 [Maribacter algarum]